MEERTTRAVILRSLPFKDGEKIVTAFSGEMGMISFIIKGLSPKQPSKHVFCRPFCEAELSLSGKRGGLLRFRDGCVINSHEGLSGALISIQTASEMARALMLSQPPELPSQDLYRLFCSFLRKTPEFSRPETLLACFHLKLLKHEGVYDSNPPPESGPCSTEQKELFKKLVTVKSFSELDRIAVSASDLDKVRGMFSGYVKR